MCDSKNNNRTLIVALFKDSEADALSATAINSFFTGINDVTSSSLQQVFLREFVVAGSTNLITFKIRFGSSNGSSVGLNKSELGGHKFGSAGKFGFTITELLP